MAAFGDDVKDPTSTRIDVGDRFNDVQNGVPFYGSTSSGASNTYVVNVADAPAAFQAGQMFYFIADKTCTGSVTIQLGAATRTCKDATGLNNLIAGAIQSGDLVQIFVDSTNCRLMNAFNLIGSGWTLLAATGAYASASSFTISGDFTSVLKPGTKIKFSNTSLKYATVLSSSYSAPNTTVNIVVNTDYVVANTTLTNVYYSLLECPPLFPSEFVYAPTLTGFSVNPTTTMYRYSVSGSGMVTVNWYQGATGTSNATGFTITSPTTCKTLSSGAWQGACNGGADNGVALTAAPTCRILSAGTTIILYKDGVDTAASWTAANGKRASGSIRYPMVGAI